MFRSELEIHIASFVDWRRSVLPSKISDVPMSLSHASRVLLERMRPVIARAFDDEIRQAITSDGPSILRDDALGVVREGIYTAFFASFDWFDNKADIVIIGVTPGKQQALEALLSFRAVLAAG